MWPRSGRSGVGSTNTASTTTTSAPTALAMIVAGVASSSTRAEISLPEASESPSISRWNGCGRRIAGSFPPRGGSRRRSRALLGCLWVLEHHRHALPRADAHPQHAVANALLAQLGRQSEHV